MKAEERRKKISLFLMSENKAISGGELALRFGVSRQIIVQDIALLRSNGYDILSTHTGYIIKSSPLVQRVFKLRHTSEQTKDELTTIVNLGGTVVNVFVWHKVYGRIEAPLNIFSEYGIDKFIEGIKSGKSTELMKITSDYHYHTVQAESEKTLDLIYEQLNAKGYIICEK